MNIYLVPAEDSTYVAHISNKSPSNEAIFLTKEGTYPTDLMYKRHDLNLDSLLMQDTIDNREDLIKSLDFIGACRNEIIKLWDFWTYDNTLVEIHKLFDRCFERKVQLITAEMFEACEDLDEDFDVGIICDADNDEDFPF